jgi:GT2 family glycosyltransferase
MIDIVIVNWNSGHYLAECVASVIAHGGAALGKIVVVDNASSDGSLTAVAPDPRIETVCSSENLGFAKACNCGAARCSAPLILFFNPDARFLPGTLDAVQAYMQSAEARGTGICGVRLTDEAGRTHRACARLPSPGALAAHALGLDMAFPRVFPPHYMLEFDHDSSRTVDQVMGAFFLVRRELFEALQGFDERFFVYYEEVDFSLRARQAGWQTWYLAEAAAFHAGGGTTDRVKATRLFYSVRSRLLYAQKHFSFWGTAAVFAVSLGIEPLTRMVLALLRGTWQEFGATFGGYAKLWRNLNSCILRPASGM